MQDLVYQQFEQDAQALELALAQQEEQARIERAENAAKLARLDRLMQNPDLEWFRDEFMRPLVDTEQKAALDIATTPETRNNHAQRYDIAFKLTSLIEQTHTFYQNKASL